MVLLGHSPKSQIPIKINCHERTYWYMLHFGYIRWFAAKTDFSGNPTTMSAFTGIHCTLATRGRSPQITVFNNNNAIATSRSTGIRCTWALLLRHSQNSQISATHWVDQEKSNHHERIYRYTLHFGYIGWLPEDTDFSNTPIAKN